jgi:cysteine desulfurase
MTRDISGFFDYASATPLDAGVFEAMQPYLVDNFYNPSALYSAAEVPKSAITTARITVASVLGVKPNEIIFTAGCTEANNLAIRGVMAKYPGKKLLISAIEHDSIAVPAAQYAYATIPVDKNGVLDLDTFARMLDDDVVLVSIIYASNEVGTVQDLRAVSKIIARAKKSRTNGLPLYLHTDAAQAANTLLLLCHTLGVDMMSLNAGKMYGPKATGCLYVSKEISLEPLVYGGGQEQGIRSGTENVAGIVGFAEALQSSSAGHVAEKQRLQILRSEFVFALGNTGIVAPETCLPGILSLQLVGIDNERVVLELDQIGYQVSSGSACHARSGKKSTVLSAIGLSEQQIVSTIRISMGRYTTSESVLGLATAIKQIVALSKH